MLVSSTANVVPVSNNQSISPVSCNYHRCTCKPRESCDPGARCGIGIDRSRTRRCGRHSAIARCTTGEQGRPYLDTCTATAEPRGHLSRGRYDRSDCSRRYTHQHQHTRGLYCSISETARSNGQARLYFGRGGNCPQTAAFLTKHLGIYVQNGVFRGLTNTPK